MGEQALRFLSSFLELESKYDPADVPSPHDEGYAEALWDEGFNCNLPSIRKSICPISLAAFATPLSTPEVRIYESHLFFNPESGALTRDSLKTGRFLNHACEGRGKRSKRVRLSTL